jgi:putative endonuclease
VSRVERLAPQLDTLPTQKTLSRHIHRRSVAFVCIAPKPHPGHTAATPVGENRPREEHEPNRDTPPKDHRRALGQLGERLAGEHLERLGFAIVDRNARTRVGEIDLVAFDGHTLVFVEVKTRCARMRWRLSPQEQPLAWLRTSQRARLRRLAAAWLHRESRNRPTAHTIRFDGIGVIVDEADRLVRLDHVEAAW